MDRRPPTRHHSRANAGRLIRRGPRVAASQSPTKLRATSIAGSGCGVPPAAQEQKPASRGTVGDKPAAWLGFDESAACVPEERLGANRRLSSSAWGWRQAIAGARRARSWTAAPRPESAVWARSIVRRFSQWLRAQCAANRQRHCRRRTFTPPRPVPVARRLRRPRSHRRWRMGSR
jgi:hypothetical protein